MTRRKQPSKDPNQILLDWESRKNAEYMQIKQALKTVKGAGLKEFHFLCWIARVETDRCGLVKDYDQIAEELYCHRATAIRMVQSLELEQVIRVRQQFTEDGAARKNEYRNEWLTIRSRLTSQVEAEYGVQVASAQSHGATGGSHGATGGSHGATGPSPDATSLKEYILSLPSSLSLLATAKEAWEKAAVELLKLGMGRARIRDVVLTRIRCEETPMDFLARIAKGARVIAAPANAGRWKNRDGTPSDGTGALRYFLETGGWPVQGVIDPDAPLSPEQARAQQLREEQERERLITEAALIARRMRDAGRSDEEIFAEQRRLGLPTQAPIRSRKELVT
jgi:predicted transcriptional regulator